MSGRMHARRCQGCGAYVQKEVDGVDRKRELVPVLDKGAHVVDVGDGAGMGWTEVAGPATFPRALRARAEQVLGGGAFDALQALALHVRAAQLDMLLVEPLRAPDHAHCLMCVLCMQCWRRAYNGERQELLEVKKHYESAQMEWKSKLPNDAHDEDHEEEQRMEDECASLMREIESLQHKSVELKHKRDELISTSKHERLLLEQSHSRRSQASESLWESLERRRVSESRVERCYVSAKHVSALTENGSREVHSDVFAFAVEWSGDGQQVLCSLNGMQLGHNWDETNGAIGCAVYALVCAADHTRFTFREWRPVPRAHRSHMQALTVDARKEGECVLYYNGTSGVSAWMWSTTEPFNRGMRQLLRCLSLLIDHMLHINPSLGCPMVVRWKEGLLEGQLAGWDSMQRHYVTLPSSGKRSKEWRCALTMLMSAIRWCVKHMDDCRQLCYSDESPQ